MSSAERRSCLRGVRYLLMFVVVSRHKLASDSLQVSPLYVRKIPQLYFAAVIEARDGAKQTPCFTF